MNQIYRKRPFWSLAGPLLGYLVIRGAIQFVIQLGIEIPYVMQIYSDMVNGVIEPTMEAVTEAYINVLGPAFESLVRYQVEIASAASLGTLALTGVLFSGDRKLEKKYGIPPAVKAPASKYWTILVFGAVGSIAATCLMAMAQMAFYDIRYEQAAESMYAVSLPVQIIGLGIIIPLAEEMMFRGIMYKRYRERQGFWYSAIWSSVFFSMMHTSMTQVIYTFCLGLMLSYLYEKFGTIKAPVLLHAVMNICSLVFTELGVFAWLGSDAFRLGVAAIAGAFVCSAVFVVIQRIPGQEKENPPEEKNSTLDMFR